MDHINLKRERKSLLLSPTSSQSSSNHERRVTFSHSAPPSPRHHNTILNSPSQGRGILLPPADYRQNSQRSSAEESRRSLQFEVPRDTSRSVTLNKPGYQPNDWGLLSIDRHGPRQKYIVTLLYWPSMTLYAWPLDPKAAFGQGLCYTTATENTNPSASNSDVIKMSVTVLEDAIRTWMRQGKPRQVDQSGGLQVGYGDIVRVCHRLNLKPTTEAQRNEWLQRQQIPDLPSSLPSSRASTPAASPGI